ncbi:MAG: alpha/beta hydrolase [Patescibacteria group bacterium]
MKYIILHGWFLSKNSDWYGWLKETLEKQGNEVFLENLPTMTTENPNLNEIINFLEQKIDFKNQEICIVGHSLGSVVALRLAEKYKFKKLILVSCWDWNDLTAEHQNFWTNPINHQKIRNNVSEIVCINSNNDPYIGWAIAQEMAEKRLNAKFVLVENAGHFTKINTFEKILEEC